VFSSVAITAVSVPAGGVVYDPARCYAVYKRRTVQHLKADADLRVLACVHDDSHVLARGVALNKVLSLELSKYDVGTVNSSLFFQVRIHKDVKRQQHFECIAKTIPINANVTSHEYIVLLPVRKRDTEGCSSTFEKSSVHEPR
jgi:hypothetical protein